MKMKQLLLLTLFLPVAWCHAQSDSPLGRYIGVSWNMNKPLSNGAFVSDFSTQGLQFIYRQGINEQFSIGGDLNYAVYKGYTPRKTYYGDSGALTTDYFNYVQSFGLTLTGDYLFSSDKKLIPFAGLGIGAAFADFKTYYNIYSKTDGSWGLLIRPQAGVMYRFGRSNNWGISVAAYFDYTTIKSSDFDFANFNSAGIRLAILFLNLE